MKFVKIAAGVIVAIILVIVVVLMTVDVSQYKGVIQDQAKAATGRAGETGRRRCPMTARRHPLRPRPRR